MYKVGKSAETALHQLVNGFERVLEQKEMAMGVSMDIEGAFDNTSFESTTRAWTELEVAKPIIVQRVGPSWELEAQLKTRVCPFVLALYVSGIFLV